MLVSLRQKRSSVKRIYHTTETDLLEQEAERSAQIDGSDCQFLRSDAMITQSP